MKTVFPLLLCVLCLTQIHSIAQDKIILQEPEVPYIEVTGTAEVEVIPDEIYINILIKEKYINRVKISLEEQEAKMINTFKTLGIDQKNLSLSDAKSDFVRVRIRKSDVLTSKEYILKVTDAYTVGNVFVGLDSLEITDAYIGRTAYSKNDSLRKEIKIQAIKAAKNKAEYLLAAIGEKVGKPLIVKENETFMPNAMSNVMVGVKARGFINFEENTKAKQDIEFQKLKYEASIYIKYGIN